jgi:hypothetical protein
MERREEKMKTAMDKITDVDKKIAIALGVRGLR